jgi:glycosyltransferase involved in cell wall biosynthesis
MIAPGNGTPQVSVIVPTYARPAYLREALDSALAQTYRDVEIIVSDNGPSEEIERLVASYGDPRLRYRHNGGNIGPMLNALAAYRSARGRYLATLHDDDVWEPTYLERLVPPLEADSNLVLAFSDHWIMRADGRVDPRVSARNSRRWGRAHLREGVHRPFYRQALIDQAVSVVTSVLRKSAFDWDDFPGEMAPLYDLWIAYLACREGRGAYYCPERLTRYRVHLGGLSTKDPYLRPKSFCYRVFLADERLRSIRTALRRRSAPVETSLGLALLETGRRAQARRHLLAGLRHAPELRGMGGFALSLLPFNAGAAISRGREFRRLLRPPGDCA